MRDVRTGLQEAQGLETARARPSRFEQRVTVSLEVGRRPSYSNFADVRKRLQPLSPP